MNATRTLLDSTNGGFQHYAYAHRTLIDYFVKRKKVDMMQTLLEFRDDYDAMYRKYEKAPASKGELPLPAFWGHVPSLISLILCCTELQRV